MRLLTKSEAEAYAKKLKRMNSWYFLAAAGLFGLVAIIALRQNNLTMIKLREQVAVVDEQDGDIEAALRDLREYVYAHMNTNLNSGANSIKPPIQLKYEYERLVAAEKARVSAQTEKVYTEAQLTCEAQFPDSFSGGPRVPCIQSYIDSRPIAEQTIPESLYKFDFVSPAWSPDLAGFSLVGSGLFMVLFLFRNAGERWLRSQL